MKRISSAHITSTEAHYRHDIRVGHHALVADEPPALGGQGAGPGPFDLWLAGLAACTAITLRMYAERKGWELGRFRVDLTLSLDDDGGAHVERVLHSDAGLSDEQWTRLVEIAANTPVTRVVRQGAEVTTTHG